jgi:hypothetical protein
VCVVCRPVRRKTHQIIVQMRSSSIRSMRTFLSATVFQGRADTKGGRLSSIGNRYTKMRWELKLYVRSAGPAIRRGHGQTLMTLPCGCETGPSQCQADLSYQSDVEKNAACWEFVRSFVNVNTSCDETALLAIYCLLTKRYDYVLLVMQSFVQCKTLV